MESKDDIERHPNGLKCKDCIHFQNCYHTIYKDGESDFCCYEKSRFADKLPDKKEDIIDRALRRIHNERRAWGEEVS